MALGDAKVNVTSRLGEKFTTSSGLMTSLAKRKLVQQARPLSVKLKESQEKLLNSFRKGVWKNSTRFFGLTSEIDTRTK